MTHLLTWGNAYAQIIRNGGDELVGLYPPMPDRMTEGGCEMPADCAAESFVDHDVSHGDWFAGCTVELR